MKTKLIVTTGPSFGSEQDLRIMKDKGVDFLRINMSHSSIEDLKRTHNLANQVGIEYVLDTEGSQIRTSCLNDSSLLLEDGQLVEIYGADDNYKKFSPLSNYVHDLMGEKLPVSFFHLNPSAAMQDYALGDIIYVNSYGPAILVIDISL